MIDPMINRILEFWFGKSGDADYGKPKSYWFNSTPEIDKQIRHDFGDLYDQAAQGQLQSWQDTPEGCLSLIILFDQFSRNLFRGTPQVFATDSRALSIAKEAILKGFDQKLPLFQRSFLYMPFMHSESLSDQLKSVELFTSSGAEAGIDYAVRHKDIIQRFGRFPHRNAILNRESTPDEIEFLKQPGSSF